jgi:hypothetical protein
MFCEAGQIDNITITPIYLQNQNGNQIVIKKTMLGMLIQNNNKILFKHINFCYKILQDIF